MALQATVAPRASSGHEEQMQLTNGRFMNEWTVADVIRTIRKTQALRPLIPFVKDNALDGYYLLALDESDVDNLLGEFNKLVRFHFRNQLAMWKKFYQKQRTLTLIVKQSSRLVVLQNTIDEINLSMTAGELMELCRVKFGWSNFHFVLRGDVMSDDVSLLRQGIRWDPEDEDHKEEPDINEQMRWCIVVDRSPKRLTPKAVHGTDIVLTDAGPRNFRDMMTFDDDPAFPRAIMPCDRIRERTHAIGPESLTKYIRICATQLKQGKVFCPYVINADDPVAKPIKCGAEWKWKDLVVAAQLSLEEQAEIQQKFLENNPNLRPCPTDGCTVFLRLQTAAGSIETTRIRCTTCGNDACGVCWQSWKGGSRFMCGNSLCVDENAVKNELLSCDMTSGYNVSFPRIRSCPNSNCREIIEHTDACKHMGCPKCSTQFCMRCLGVYRGGWPCGSHRDVCTLAPQQIL